MLGFREAKGDGGGGARFLGSTAWQRPGGGDARQKWVAAAGEMKCVETKEWIREEEASLSGPKNELGVFGPGKI